MREQQFGKYILLDRIAVGGMAEIFLARQTGLEGFEKTVVLKRIRPHLGDKKSFVKMFLNEARLAAQLTHPNIIHIHDLGKIGDSYFLAMEYLFGRDMRRVIPKADSLGIPFPVVYACKIASQVLEGLYYAHRRTDVYGSPLGIVHRDVTPENIFVSFDGGVKILDFGIAKAANQVEMTRAGEIKGKLSYMSPEQCMGKPLDARSDIFSLGVVLYEWVTGFKLFTGESDVAVLKSITDGKIYRPSYFKQDVPEQVEAIIMKALEKDLAARYQTAWEMQRDLDAFLAGNEFTPSNNHLATFMKQLFADEMEEEKKRLQNRGVALAGGAAGEHQLDSAGRAGHDTTAPGRRTPLPPEPPKEAKELPTPPDGSSPPALPIEEQLETLSVSFESEEMNRLQQLADRNGLTVPALVQQIVQGHLRFR